MGTIERPASRGENSRGWRSEGASSSSGSDGVVVVVGGSGGSGGRRDGGTAGWLC